MSYDAAVVGSGPNGLAAAVTLARAGLSVCLYERNPTLGGGARTAELTLPGFAHDVCSAVHPMALASPFFQAFELDRRIELLVPEVSYGHPLDGGRAGIGYRDLDRTAQELGADGAAYKRLLQPIVERIAAVTDFTGHPLLRRPADLGAVFTYGIRVLEQGSPLWNLRFREDVAPAMISGLNAHSMGKMPRPAPAGAGLLLGAHAHAAGWPVPRGGSQRIIDAMAADFQRFGGHIVLDTEVSALEQLDATVLLFDVSAAALGRIAGGRLPPSYLRKLAAFRYGNAAAKVDFALSGPVPWANPALASAPTVHLGGDRAALARSEAQVAAGQHPQDPYVLLSQPSILDPSRAPAGSAALWTYAHVPRGSTVDMTAAVTAQIERFAPGFRDVVLASSAITAEEYSRYDPNYIGGDFSAGAVNVYQLFKRPVISPVPWRTPVRGLYLCSSSTAPGPAVHGLCGWYAARTALQDIFDLPAPELGMDR